MNERVPRCRCIYDGTLTTPLYKSAQAGAKKFSYSRDNFPKRSKNPARVMPGPSRPLWQVAGKRDPEQECEAQQWIEQVTGMRFPQGVPYDEALRDGILLCTLMNKLKPGIISKINTSGGDYKMMDNISQFQKACTKYGVPDVDLFQTTDLWDGKNIVLVTQTIFAIGRTAYKHPEWRGPMLGPKPSEEHKREWTEEQLRAGESVIGLQAGSNKGASQAGENFGASRKIIFGK